jgi:hypothetical protein
MADTPPAETGGPPVGGGTADYGGSRRVHDQGASMRSSAPALLLTLAGLAFAGCGGGGDELSRSELISKADAICHSVNAKTRALGRPASFADLERLGGKARTITDDGISKLKELTPPKELQDDWNRFVDMADRQRGFTSDLVDAAKAKDAQKVQRIATAASANANKLHALAKRNGFQDCSSD